MRNVEIKARYRRTRKTDSVLKRFKARKSGDLIQTDTYFDVNAGRLKVREHQDGHAEMIHYVRQEQDGPRISNYEIVPLRNKNSIKAILKKEHGIRAVVKKHREVWLWRNVRIHFDQVEDLGSFIEFEVVLGRDETEAEGHEKIGILMTAFGITMKDLIYQSYEDFLIRKPTS